MPRNGSGTYTPPSNSWNPAVDATDIDVADWNDMLDDLATALTGSLTANGEKVWTGNQNAGGYKTTGLAAGTTSGDALAYQQIGAQIQGYSTLLAAIAALTPTDGNVIVGNGTTWIVESGATARASLGLIIGTDVQAYDADLAAIAALTSAANKLPYATGAQTWALTDFTAQARSFVGQADLSATDAAEGLVELATTAEVQALTDTVRAVTPAGLATIGAPLLLDTLDLSSGSSDTSITLPACRAFLILFKDVSGTGTAAMQCVLSDDDGANWSGNFLPTATQSSAYSRDGSIWIMGTGSVGNKVTHSYIGTAGGGEIGVRTEIVSSETGVTNKFRIQISAGSFDSGAAYIYGFR